MCKLKLMSGIMVHDHSVANMEYLPLAGDSVLMKFLTWAIVSQIQYIFPATSPTW